MAVKIRLARKGGKRKAYYHIVVSDSRSPRDGRYIERIGTYNPVTHPATVELDFDKALGWLQNGAQPTDTCRNILSARGVLIKKHLIEGVKKGAFDEVEANRRFEEWEKQNEARLDSQKSKLERTRDDDKAKRIEAEKLVNEKRAAKVAKKLAALETKTAAEASTVSESPATTAPAEPTSGEGEGEKPVE